MANPILDLPGEVWKPVVGYEGSYEVSDHGRVKSLARNIHRRDRWGGLSGRRVTGMLRKPQVRNGYRYLTLLHTDRRFIHRLVLEAFVGPCPEGMEACHNDGNPANNQLENLRWDTRKANHADKRIHGTLVEGYAHPAAKLTFAQIEAIRVEYAVRRNPTELAKRYGIAYRTVFKYVYREARRRA
jgi:hypothetical protein